MLIEIQGLPENYAPLLVENIKKGEYTHVVAGHSAFGKSLLPRVAALLDVQQISDITAIESEDSMWPPDRVSLDYVMSHSHINPLMQLLSAQSTLEMPSSPFNRPIPSR
jgi:electron transfer flavoprotein alpha subunit